jgi:PAS domain S-box-containing protein
MTGPGPTPPAERWSEALFQALTRHSGDIISMLDAQGRLLFNSAAAERISGFSLEELAGADTTQHVHAEDREAVGRAFAALLATPGAVVTVQYRYATKAGGWTWMEAVASNQLHDPEVRAIVASSRDISERKAAEEALHRSEERLRALAARLESIREEESARVARDLHDDLGQALTAQEMDLRWLEEHFEAEPATPLQGQVVDRLVAAREASRRMLASVQRIAAGAWPAALEKLGLAAALRQEVRRFGERTRLPVTLRIEAEPPPGSPPSTALFRICQEALTNVARHAAATRVEVALRAEGDALVLEVVDDGCGLPARRDDGRPSLGILSMKERALTLGGEVRVEAGPAGGTVVTARLPLAVPARPAGPGRAGQ